MTRLGVLMVTGAYDPEISGAGLQCRELTLALRDQVSFAVLTTSVDRTLPDQSTVDGVPVHRVFVQVRRLGSKVRAALRIARFFIRHQRQFAIVHLHGFSKKSWLLVVLTRIFRKPLVLKLTSAGYDDPLSVRRRDLLGFRWYRQADLYIGVSDRLEALYLASELPREKFRLIPNGVNLDRFRPHDAAERALLRKELGLPLEETVILFVGFFSRDKCPEVLFDAWMRLQRNGGPRTELLFVGATRGSYYEIDPALVAYIRETARRQGRAHQLIFVERTHAMEKYYGAADCFVLPSVREGLPNTLLEAMASGLPCIVTRLPGVTDGLIGHGVNGLLVPPRDVGALEQALWMVVRDPALAQEWGRRARKTVEGQCGMREIAGRYLEVYRSLVR